MPAPPERAIIERRLAMLRSHRWSSYPAYAGYARAPEWFTRETLWQRVARRREVAAEAYRHGIEDYLKQGLEEGAVGRLTQALAIGSTAFVEKLRSQLTGASGDRTNVRAWRRHIPFTEVVRAVEAVRGAAWPEFAGCRGDRGRQRIKKDAPMRRKHTQVMKPLVAGKGVS
jgi:hypothetical protein